MSTAAAKNFPAASGSSAASRTLPAQTPGDGRKGRTPLSVVRTVPRKRRAPFVVLCFAMLAVALVAVLDARPVARHPGWVALGLVTACLALTRENALVLAP